MKLSTLVISTPFVAAQQDRDYGRCHIYYAGDYGFCNSYQVTPQDIDGTCGKTPQTACISTSLDAASECGMCYRVTERDTGASTYIRVIDQNSSNVKFEMSQTAYQNICPHLCKAEPICVNDPSECPWGAFDNPSSYPGGCYHDRSLINYETVDCNGGGDFETSYETSSYEEIDCAAHADDPECQYEDTTYPTTYPTTTTTTTQAPEYPTSNCTAIPPTPTPTPPKTSTTVPVVVPTTAPPTTTGCNGLPNFDQNLVYPVACTKVCYNNETFQNLWYINEGGSAPGTEEWNGWHNISTEGIHFQC